MTAQIKDQLRRFVIDTFLFGQDDGRLSDAASLLEAGIIDSTGVLEVVAMLGERYGIAVDDNELVPDNFDSLDRLAAYVERKRSSAGGV